MRACRHEDVPSGGIVGGPIGAMAGAAIGQMSGGQIGGMSSELSHSGRISPSKHWQVHEASDGPFATSATQTLIPISTHFIGSPWSDRASGCLNPRIEFLFLLCSHRTWMAKPY